MASHEEEQALARADFKTAMQGFALAVVVLGIIMGGSAYLAVVLH